MLSSPWVAFWKWYIPCALLLSALIGLGWQWRVGTILRDAGTAEQEVVDSGARIAQEALRSAAADLSILRNQNELRD